MSLSFLLVQVPNLMGFVAMLLAGKKRRIGWALGFWSEFAWATWATYDHAYGIYPWCVIWSVVYARNWWLWRQGGTHAIHPA